MGVLGGIPASARHLAFQAEQVPAGSRWKVIGISRDQWPLAMAALSLGGDVRVGLEDNFYLPGGAMAAVQRRARRGRGRAGEAVRTRGGERRRGAPPAVAGRGREVSLPGEDGELGAELVVRARARPSRGRPRCSKLRGGELGVEMKAGNEPVTIADRRASEP